MREGITELGAPPHGTAAFPFAGHVEATRRGHFVAEAIASL